MASHVPFLAVRPDDQFSPDIKTRDFAAPVNGIATSAMENAPIRATSASRIPAPLRYALIGVLSLGLNTVAYTLTAEWAGVELAAVSRDSTEDWRIWVPVAWKLVELTFAGWSGYDCEFGCDGMRYTACSCCLAAVVYGISANLVYREGSCRPCLSL